MKKRELGITLSYINTLFNMVLGLVLSSFLLRSLGDTEYGLYQTIAAFANTLVLFELGTGTAMQRGILLAKNEADPSKVERVISTIWYITWMIAALMIIIASIFYVNIGRVYSNTMSYEQVAYGKKMFVFLTGYVIMVFATQSLNGVLIGMEQYTFTQAINVIKTIIRALSLIGVILFYKYSIIIAIVDFVVSTCAFCVTFFYCKSKYKLRFRLSYFDIRILKDALPLCLALFLQSFIDQANSNVDKLVLGVTMTVESVALYSVAQYVYFVFVSVCIAPITMYLPQISKDLNRTLSPREFTATLIPACRLTALIAGTIMCGFFAVGKQFISMFYGEDKVSAWIYALILIIPTFVNQTNFVIVNILDLTKKRLVRSIALGITAVLNLILTIVFVHYFGIIGAVVATAISMIIGNILIMNIYYARNLKINILYLFRYAYKGILLYQLIAAAIAFVVSKFIANTLASFILGGCIYLAFSLILIYKFGFEDSEKEIVLKIKSKLLKSKNTQT